MRKQNHTGRAVSIPSGLAMGAAVSMAVTVAVSFIGAQMILNELMVQEHIGYCSLAALLAGVILGALTACRRIKHRKLMVCMLSGCVYVCMLLGITALFFGGQYEGFGATVITVILGSLVSGLIATRKGERNNRYRRKKL